MAMKRKARVDETQAVPTVKNLYSLKQLFRKGGAAFKIIAHRRIECIGEVRTVTKAGSTGFYSRTEDGKELWLAWGTAKQWEFGEVCSVYSTPERKELVMSFKIEGGQQQ